MALINISYGSLASSETMNHNFSYLDDRITSTSESISTSISSIQSNIATINSRITSLAEDISDSLTTLSSTVESYKAKTKLLVKQANIVPDWSTMSEISIPNTGYSVSTNGYVVIKSIAGKEGTLKINNNLTWTIDNSGIDSDNTLPVIVPVKSGDILYGPLSGSVYFVPAINAAVSGF